MGSIDTRIVVTSETLTPDMLQTLTLDHRKRGSAALRLEVTDKNTSIIIYDTESSTEPMTFGQYRAVVRAIGNLRDDADESRELHWDDIVTSAPAAAVQTTRVDISHLLRETERPALSEGLDLDGMSSAALLAAAGGLPEAFRDACVGIFWVVKGQLLVWKTPVGSDDTSGAPADWEDAEDDYQIDFDQFHKDIWPAELYEEFGHSYDYYPRGRILYKVRSRRFAVHTSALYPALSTTQFIEALCAQFGIPVFCVQLVKDYRSVVGPDEEP